jgi:Holliday junction DNA helicase RuvB
MFEKYIGQDHIKNVLSSLIAYHKNAPEPLQNILITGPSGLGKSTIAQEIAKEMGVNCITLLATNASEEDLIRAICQMKDKDLIFIDEGHSLSKKLIEILFPVMSERTLYAMYQGRMTKFKTADFTIILATTHQGKLPIAFLNRFTIPLNLVPYTEDDLVNIAKLYSKGMFISDDMYRKIVALCKGVPRTLINIMKNIVIYLKSIKQTTLTNGSLDKVKMFLGVNEIGLNNVDFEILKYLCKVKAASLKTLASVLSIEAINIEQVHEPYLIKLGFIERCSAGRSITDTGRKYLVDKQI